MQSMQTYACTNMSSRKSSRCISRRRKPQNRFCIAIVRQSAKPHNDLHRFLECVGFCRDTFGSQVVRFGTQPRPHLKSVTRANWVAALRVQWFFFCVCPENIYFQFNYAGLCLCVDGGLEVPRQSRERNLLSWGLVCSWFEWNTKVFTYKTFCYNNQT